MTVGRSQKMRGGTSKDNEWLTFVDRRATVGLNRAGHYGLNGFFANSVNSLSMSMVNFSCCVCPLPDVTREVTAQPTRSAV
jgi:hypothetical protein